MLIDGSAATYSRSESIKIEAFERLVCRLPLLKSGAKRELSHEIGNRLTFRRYLISPKEIS